MAERREMKDQVDAAIPNKFGFDEDDPVPGQSVCLCGLRPTLQLPPIYLVIIYVIYYALYLNDLASILIGSCVGVIYCANFLIHFELNKQSGEKDLVCSWQIS